MKFLVNKKKSLVLTLCGMMLGLLSCSNTANKTEQNKDYPPAPPALMQASLTKVDGTNFKLEGYKGKVVLVNVWATWCGPCRQEIPELIKLQTANQDKGFEIIGLDLDEGDSPEMIKEFGSQLKINYPLARGEEKLFQEFYRVSQRDAIPQSFLIDREGRLLGVFVGGGGALKRLIESVNKVMAE
jgi:thiol-disulfide isomerase/thioredoxin